MNLMILCPRSHFSPKNINPLQQSSCVKAVQSPVTQTQYGVLNRSQDKKKYIKCSQKSFYQINKIGICKDINIISNQKSKPFNKYGTGVPLALQDVSASKSDDDNNSTTFLNAFIKNLNALFRFSRSYALLGTVIAIASVSLLPLQRLDDLTITYFTGVLKVMVAGLLMTIYEGAINQLYDVEIDKVNKPDLPLASGDISMGTGIAIASSSVLMSLAIGIMLRSPPFLLGLILWFLLGSAYSVDLPLLRWKRNSFLTTMYMVLERGFVLHIAYFLHIQKYVLGRPLEITRTLMFVVAIKCCYLIVISTIKDIPDEEGDRKNGIKTLSVIIGKEKVLWLGVHVLLCAYGAAVIVGASSPFLISKFVTIISHSILASLLLCRAQAVDLSSKASTQSFYMFIWKLHYAEYLLIPFVRL